MICVCIFFSGLVIFLYDLIETMDIELSLLFLSYVPGEFSAVKFLTVSRFKIFLDYRTIHVLLFVIATTWMCSVYQVWDCLLVYSV